MNHNTKQILASIDRCRQELEMLRNRVTESVESEQHKDSLTGVSNVDEILNDVVRYYGLTVTDLRGPSRTRAYTLPRMVAAHLLRANTRMTLTDIGSTLQRDHTTVLHMLSRNAEEMKVNPAHRSTVDSMSQVYHRRSLKKLEHEKAADMETT